MSADYSQIELRIMAHMSKDKGLLNAFGNGLDIHSETASRIFKVPLELVSAEMRRTAKIVNFGIMYGAGPFRMSQELGVTRNEANEVIKSYFKQFVGIRDYIDQVIDQARNMNYVKLFLVDAALFSRLIPQTV